MCYTERYCIINLDVDNCRMSGVRSMKRILCIFLCLLILVFAASPISAYVPQNSRAYQSSDDTGIYTIRFNGKHADITRYASHTLNAGVDVPSPIRSVCAYRGKTVLLCEDVRKNQLSVFVYYLDTDFLEGFVINDALLYNNTDFACDNGAIYIENYRDEREVSAFSYSGSYFGRYRFDSEINAVFGGFHDGIYAVAGDTLYRLSSGRFNALSGDEVDTPLFPADSNTYVSGHGKVYQINGDQLSYLFTADYDNHAASACVIGNTLYYPNGSTINAYDLDSGEKIAYYRGAGQIISVYTNGNTVIATGDSGSFTVRISDFTSLKVDDDTDESGADDENHDSDHSNGGDTAADRTGQQRSEPSSISSDVYQVDSARYYISDIPEQTTVAAFKKNMRYDGYSLTIYRGNAVKKSGNIGTAMRAVFDSEDFTYTYELAITGDITGEGNRNSRDLNTLMDYLIGASDFNGVYMLAADLTNDNRVDVCDVATLKGMI